MSFMVNLVEINLISQFSIGYGKKQTNQILEFNKDNFFAVYGQVLSIVSAVKYIT